MLFKSKIVANIENFIVFEKIGLIKSIKLK